MTLFDGQPVMLLAAMALMALLILMIGLGLAQNRKASRRKAARQLEAAVKKERADLIFDTEIRRVLLRVRGNRSV